MFTFNHIWRLITYGNDPQYAQQFARHIYTMRMFADSQSLARTAFLENEPALEMLAPDAALPWNRLTTLFKSASRHQDVRRIYSQSADLFDKFKVLVATPYAVRGLPQQALDGLRKFAETGGTIVAIDSDWSTARGDMENEKNMTVEMAGITYQPAPASNAVSFTWHDQDVSISSNTPRRIAKIADETVKITAQFDDGTPAITEKNIGKGRVIALHFDAGAELSQNENTNLSAAFNRCLIDAAQPPALLMENQDNQAVLTAALKKGNWVAVALFPEMPPVGVKLRVDVKAMGIEKEGFRVLLLGKQMELSRPGDFWGTSGFWTPADLKNGFRVSLPEDQRRFLPLPEEFDLSDFTGKRGQADAEYLDKITRDWWDSEKRGKRKRDYAHEVVVIAPADEPAMPRP